MEKWYEWMGLVAVVALPLFNIPLILRIVRTKSSRDISLVWTFGVWGCILLMLPSSLISKEPVFRTFGVLNASLFCSVVVTVLIYRKRN
jgi:uncharacterized protein with PQ loop repeat